jgi:hypothetical protein
LALQDQWEREAYLGMLDQLVREDFPAREDQLELMENRANRDWQGRREMQDHWEHLDYWVCPENVVQVVLSGKKARQAHQEHEEKLANLVKMVNRDNGVCQVSLGLPH